MLCVNKYPQDYVDRCRSRVNEQLCVYKDLIVAATSGNKSKDTKINAAVETFEPMFFNNLVLVLDTYFVHRSRAMEGKDGNALNEVRVLCNSILENHSVLRVDKTIKIKPDASVLKLKSGDPIALREADFLRLSKAFFDEIERTFME
jgi:hypothetical protein